MALESLQVTGLPTYWFPPRGGGQARWGVSYRLGSGAKRKRVVVMPDEVTILPA